MNSEYLPEQAELPEGFRTRIHEAFPGPLGVEILSTFVERPPSMRVNTIKSSLSEVLAILARLGISATPVPWCQEGLLLPMGTKRSITDSSEYLAGTMYLQSLASMVPTLALDPTPGDEVLDLTAAPGSKTSHIAMRMQRSGRLVANDSSRARFFKLLHNLSTLGVYRKGDPFCRLHQEDGSRLCGKFPLRFDKILLDAPCSAEARFISGDARSFEQWSERAIRENVQRQRKLLFSAWHALKPGGTLVYSTCTLAPEENEFLLDMLLQKFPTEIEVLPLEFRDLSVLPAVLSFRGKEAAMALKDTLRIAPTRLIESFYVAKLLKRGR